MRVTVLVQYNHQAELDALVAAQNDPTSPQYHHYLTNDQFNAYYAPTPQQYQQVEQTLRAEGFTITGEFSNRTLIDAEAPAAVVERTSHTQLHAVSQGHYGSHYMNVEPATLPAELTGIVKDVTLNDLVLFHTRANVATAETGGRHTVARRFVVPGNFKPSGEMPMFATQITNLISNPGFESGAINNGWFQCGNVNASVTTAHPHSGLYDEKSGSTNGEPYGDTGVCQQITVPANGILSFWVYRLSDEPNTSYAWQEADLLDAYGNVVKNFYTTVVNVAGWQELSYDLSAYAGKTFYLYFGVHGDGYPYLYTEQFVDDVSLTSGSATPPPPTPTPAPTPTPTPKPSRLQRRYPLQHRLRHRLLAAATALPRSMAR